MSERHNAMLEGLDRNEIHWNPVINSELCTNCGTCVDYCKQNVFGKVGDIVQVVNPTKCGVLSNHCLDQCPSHAISFPNKLDLLKELRDLRKRKQHA